MKQQLYRITGLILSVFALLGFVHCSSGSGSEGGGPTPVVVEPPTVATPVYPADQTLCAEGRIISETLSAINFQWQEGLNTDSYTLEITDGNGAKRSITATSGSKEVEVERGMAFSWKIISRSTKTTETASSAIFSFFNAGAATENFAPMPARLLSPRAGATVSATNLTLEWEGADLDQNIERYTVYLQAEGGEAPEVYSGSLSSYSLSGVSAGVYRWWVDTRDSTGLQSRSEQSEFRVE